MRRFLDTLAGRIAFCVGLAALYVGALAIQKVSYFYYALALAFAVTALPYFGKLIVSTVRRYLNYPELLRRVAELGEANSQLVASRGELEALAKAQYEAGLQEGKAEIFGAVFSQASNVTPALRAMTLRQGVVHLMADCATNDVPSVGSRYRIMTNTGECRGVVEVVHRTKQPPGVLFACVRNDAPAFWEHLADQAQFSTDLPGGLRLESTVIDTQFKPRALPRPQLVSEGSDDD